MPKSSPPRHARGLPQHQRDLKSWSETARRTGLPLKPTKVVEPELMHRARHAAPMGSRGRNALTAGGIVAGGLAAHAYRARSSEPVGKGLVSIPARHVSQGGAAGIKRLKGAAEEAAQSTWKTKIGQSSGRMGKAYKPTTPYEGALRLRRTLMQSKESAQRAKVQPFLNGMRGDVPARGPMNEYDFGAGVKAHHSIMRQRGVSKSLPEATAVRRVTPRTQSGRYVSHENDLVYIQPRSFGSRRPTRDSKLQVWHKKGKSAVGKASVTEAPLPTLADTAAYTGARRGRRDNVLKSVTGAAEGEFKRVAGDLYGRMSRKEITHAQYKTGHDNARNAFHIQTGQATPAPHIKVLPKMPKRHITLPTGPRSDRKLAAPPSL